MRNTIQKSNFTRPLSLNGKQVWDIYFIQLRADASDLRNVFFRPDKKNFKRENPVSHMKSIYFEHLDEINFLYACTRSLALLVSNLIRIQLEIYWPKGQCAGRVVFNQQIEISDNNNRLITGLHCDGWRSFVNELFKNDLL